MSAYDDSGSTQGDGRWQSGPSRRLSDGVDPFAAEALHLREMLAILRRRYSVVLLVTFVVVAGAAAWLWAMPRLYQATAAVLIVDARRSLAGPILNEPSGRGVGRLTDPIRSHIQVLQGRAVLGKAVDREALRLVVLSSEFPRHLLSDVTVSDSARIDAIELAFSSDRVTVKTSVGEARFDYGARIEVGGVGFVVETPPPVVIASLRILPRESAIDRLYEQLRVLHRTGTDVIEVSYTSTDPVRAQRVVNTVVDVFQVHNLQMVQQQTTLRRVFLEDQLRSTDAHLAAAQRALNDFRQARHVYRSTEQLSAHQQALMSLDIQRAGIESDRRMYGSLLDVLRTTPVGTRSSAIRTLVSSPGIASNAVVSQLYAQLLAHETSRDELITGPHGSTRANPDVERLDLLIATTEDKLIDASQSHVTSLDARLAAFDDLRSVRLAEMQELPRAEMEEARLVQDINTISNLAELIRGDLQRSRMAEAIETGQVEILHMAPPAQPIFAARRKRVVLALILGLMFGGGAAFALEFMDGSIRRRRDVELILHRPCLAVIPPLSSTNGGRHGFRLTPTLHTKVRRKRSALPPILFPAGSGATAGVEAFRRLRNNLFLPGTTGQGAFVLMVTSALPGEGKTITAANLAVTVARQGQRTLLVDADLQRPGVHAAFHLPLEPGLTDVLLGRETLKNAVRQTGQDRLSVLTAGAGFQAADDPFHTDKLRSFLGTLDGTSDVVILDTPPVLAVADVTTFARVSDGVLMVFRAGTTRPDIALQAVEELGRAGARILGGVLADPDRKILEDARFYEDYGSVHHGTSRG
jgi:polysaccharide biosynthesis transport protein